MKFRFYDVLSHIIPGFILYIVYLDQAGKTFSNDEIVPAIAIAFVLGYFVNTLASWIQGVLHWSWGGKPSSKLLKGDAIWKVKLHEHEKIKGYLVNINNEGSSGDDVLFAIAKRYAHSSDNARIADFNSVYAFSRALLTTVILVTIVYLIQEYKSLEVYAISIPILFIAWLRSKQRAYYYSREVLNTFLHVIETKK